VGVLVGGHDKARIIIQKTGLPKSLADCPLRQRIKAAAVQAAKDALAAVPVAGRIADLGGIEDTIEVQFNPSSIRFDANADTMEAKYMEDNFDSAIPNRQSRRASIVMTVDLIFDAVHTKDAFFGDKYRISPSDTVAAADAVAQAFMGGYTVQKQTQALIAAMMNEDTRRIAFVWTDMCFVGILSEVQAKYTMFSPSGNPIRSMITLSLQQDLEDSDVEQWNSAFTKFWEKAKVPEGVIKGKSAFQEAGRFINIGF
jgi:hypothetical protein